MRIVLVQILKSLSDILHRMAIGGEIEPPTETIMEPKLKSVYYDISDGRWSSICIGTFVDFKT